MPKYNITAEYAYGTNEPIEADNADEAYNIFLKDLNSYYVDTIDLEIEETEEDEEDED